MAEPIFFPKKAMDTLVLWKHILDSPFGLKSKKNQ